LEDTHREYGDGDFICREGDVGDVAFVILEGTAELLKATPRGLERAALLSAGERFGTSAEHDHGVYAATIRAVGRVVVEAVPKLHPPDPLQAQGAGGSPSGNVDDEGRESSGPGLFGRFSDWYRAVGPGHLDLRLAQIVDEAGTDVTGQVMDVLGKPPGLGVRPAKVTTEPVTADTPPERIAAMAEMGREWLKGAGGDLLIWGEVPPPGTTVHLRLVSAIADDDGRPGALALTNTLCLPIGFGADFAPLLHAAALAAAVPANNRRRRARPALLAKVLEPAGAVLRTLPGELTARERGTLRMAFANAVATVAGHLGSADHFQLAAQNYREALEDLSADDAPDDWALTQAHLGAVLHILVEHHGGADTLTAAATALRAALQVLTKTAHPRQWAAAQNRLGLVLYRLDAHTGDTELLKGALSAYQSALQVYSRAETPLVWAEVMNNFAQAAQVLGQHLRNPDVIAKAVDACRSALAVRTRSRTPLLWATTQNNLGSALFMLGRLTRNAGDLEDAGKAFGRAQDLYRKQGSRQLAAIAEKNLSRVEAQLRDLPAPGRQGKPGAVVARTRRRRRRETRR
jgi:tetratricopeptide (TPR) repeat protein